MFFTSIKSGWISFLVILLSEVPCIAQATDSDRYELTLDDRAVYESPKVAALGKDGVLIYHKVRDKAKDFLEVIKIDTTLTENWRGGIPIEKNLIVSKVETQDHIVYALLHSAGYGGYDFQVIAMDVRTQNYNTYVVKNLIPLKPTDFKISSNGLLIGGYFNDIPVVLHFNIITGRSRLLPGFFNDVGVLNQIKVYGNGLIDIIVSTKNIQRKKVLWLRTYSSEGDLINTTILQDENKNLIFGRSLRKPDGTQIVAGNFALRNSDYSKGVFITEIDPDGVYTLRYHNFSDFENYFKYMKPSREARVKERIERRKLKGKKIRYTYLFQTHELHQYGDEYLLLGETFYPRYYYLNSFGYYNRGDRIFDGYRYTHALIVGFDQDGELVWDNTFEMNDVKTFDIIQYVKLAPRGEQLGLLYLYENEVRSKTINQNQVLKEKSKQPLKLKYDSDNVKEKKTVTSFLEYWYSPYFLAWGIQEVSHSNTGNDFSDRTVLFINKIKYP